MNTLFTQMRHKVEISVENLSVSTRVNSQNLPIVSKIRIEYDSGLFFSAEFLFGERA